jgi:uncharacterized protein (TIGR03435 family)
MRSLLVFWVAFLALVLRAQPQPSAAHAKFDVVSIRPSECGKGPIGPQGPPPDWIDRPLPSRLRFCANVSNLILMAYFRYQGGHLNPHELNGPAMPANPPWIGSDNFMIDAKASGNPSQEMMRGPMLKALLEDRFKLRVHPETKQVPVYELQIAKGGSKLERFREGSCTPPRQAWRFDQPAGSGPPCGGGTSRKGSNVVQRMSAVTMEMFSGYLVGPAGRPVINKTGLTGEFNVLLEYAAPEDQGASPSDGPGASIFTALKEQLGLTLISAKGPREYIVVDHVEHPTPN